MIATNFTPTGSLNLKLLARKIQMTRTFTAKVGELQNHCYSASSIKQYVMLKNFIYCDNWSNISK
jgi:hypothetical protein